MGSKAVPFKRRLAQLLRRWPWTVDLAWPLWRLTNARFSVGVVGVVFDQKGRLLLVEHVFHPRAPWGLPGGWVGRHETPVACLRRELQEETRLEIQVGPLLLLRPGGGVHAHLDVAYLCAPRGAVGRLSGELLAYRWFAPDDLPPVPLFHRAAIEEAVRRRNGSTSRATE